MPLEGYAYKDSCIPCRWHVVQQFQSCTTICDVSVQILPHSSGQPKVLLVDTAFINRKPTKYYINRDGDAWRLTYGNAGFKVSENTQATEPTMQSFDVLHCLGLKKRHLCLQPGHVHKLRPHQRVSFIDGMCVSSYP